jgi:chromosome partitioning protein
VHTVAVLNEKGGSGKTTIATNLASAWQRDGYRVLLVDVDPQATALDWSAFGDTDVTVVTIGRGNLDRDLRRVADSFDLAVIDGAPRMTKLTAASVRVSDFVLIPVRPSAPDIWSAETVVDVCEQQGTPAAFVVSSAVVGTTLSDVADDALSTFGIPVLSARTHQRIAYARAIGRGASVLDLSGATKAAAEIRDLADEVLTHLPTS